MRTAGHSMKVRYDWQSREQKYDVGDHVWLHNPLRKKGFSPKLQSPWEGPYEVHQVLSEVTYKIRRGHHGRTRGHSPGREERHEDEEGNVEEWKDQPDAEGSLEKLQHGTSDPAEEPFIEVTGDDTDCCVGVELLTGQEDGRPQRERQAPKWMADYVVDASANAL
ncbi:hypothetical protein E2C01_043915 [Portunus trituberculatus]|uniref:Uncharacterized protein n=1 Tax=Portunus trituberculatus TaxID=210409 RepID=A0A5B7FYK5_PORTR|nr:hypothetical protein [Portunus trituberculatus]